MVREYIGARYVPRFVGIHNITQIYDALDVVDNGSGTSYIARKTVPAGTPLTNSEYWFVYGASSGAILNLQTRMGAAENDILDLQDIDKKRVVLITDSYGTVQSGQFPTVFGAALDKTSGVDYFHSAVGGNGFVGGSSFLAQLQTLEAAPGYDKDTITDIVVVGGVNDGTETYADIYAAVVAFCSHVATNYPIAKTHIGFISKSTTPGAIYAMQDSVLKAYQFGALAGARACYITNSEIILGNEMIDSDHIHPTLAGCNFLGWGLANYMLNGTVSSRSYHISFGLSPIAAFPIATPPNITVDKASGDDLYIHSPGFNMGVASNTPCNYFVDGAKLADCPYNSLLVSPSYEVGSLPVTVSFKVLNAIAGGTEHIWLDCAGKLMFRPDGVYLKALPSYDYLSKNFSQFAIWQGIDAKINPFYI